MTDLRVTYDVGCGEVYTNNDERLFMRNDDDFEEEWESSPRADADLANRIEDSNTELLEKFPRTDSFAKILKSDGSFQYIRVLEIVKFVHNEKWKRIHRMTGKVTKFNTKMFAFKMKYREMDVVRLWRDCVYDQFEFCYSARLKSRSGEEEELSLWLDNRVAMFPCSLTKGDQMLLDCHPSFGEVFEVMV